MSSLVKLTASEIADERFVYYADAMLNKLPSRAGASWYTYKGQLWPIASGTATTERTYYLTRASIVGSIAPTLSEVQSVYSATTSISEGDNIVVRLSNGNTEYWDIMLGIPSLRFTDTGSVGNEQYTHTQAAPALIWNVIHGLGSTSPDSVNVYVGGRKVYTDVDIVDANTITITFAIAQSGYATVEL